MSSIISHDLDFLYNTRCFTTRGSVLAAYLQSLCCSLLASIYSFLRLRSQDLEEVRLDFASKKLHKQSHLTRIEAQYLLSWERK